MLSNAAIWLIFAAYFIFLISVAVITTRKEKRTAGRVDLQRGKFRWPVMVMTYIASCMSVWVFFAGPGAYYRYGLSYFFTEMCAYIMFPIICYFTMTKVWLVNQEKHFTTPADFFYCRYQSKALTVVIDIVYIVCAIPFISAVLVAAGRAAEVASGGALPANTFTAVTGIIMVCFVMLGGVKSTAFADAIQGWFFIAALWIVIVVALRLVFGGSLVGAFEEAYRTTPAWFSYPGPVGVSTYPSRFSYPLCCAFGYTLLLPQIFVRSGYYSADLKDQRRMALVAPILQILVWGGTMLIGLVALAWNPNLSSTDTELVIPYLINFISGQHPHLAQALMGIFLIGVLAVGLSTANALLMTMSSIIYKDLLTDIFGFHFKKSEKSVVRIVIVLFGAATIVVSLMHWDLIYGLMIFADSMVLSLLPALVFGIYWKRATSKAAVLSVAVGAALICVTWFVWDLGYTWYGTIGLAAAALIMWLVSLATRDDPKKSAPFFEALEKSHNRFMVVKAKIK